jgi:hypothetical protein
MILKETTGKVIIQQITLFLFLQAGCHPFCVESLTRNWDASKQRFFTIGARFAMMLFWASPLRGSKTT